MTPVDTLGEPVTVVDTLGEPVVLINEDGTPAFLAYSAKTYLGGVAPYHWLDFINNRALYASVDVGDVTQATGYSFTRASEGYYTNSDGTLTLFGSGALRRGDRGVLIEGSRTNLLTYSQEFDNAAWSKARVTVTANAITAPDGTLTADKLVETAETGAHVVAQAATFTAAAHTHSVFAKAAERNFVLISMQNTTFAVGVNLTTGEIVSTNGAPTVSVRPLANGWWRISLTATTLSGSAGNNIYSSQDGVFDNRSYAGDGTFGIFIWGAQLEAASFPSSYIPTVAAAATRAADVLTYTAGVSYPLSLWAEFERAVDTGAVGAVFQIDAGSNNDAARIEHNSSTPALARGLVATGGVQQALVSAGTITLNQVTKMAQRVQTDSVNFARNTTLGNEDTSATLPDTPTTMRVGQTATGAWPFGYIRRAAVFNSALTDAQLQTTTGS
jgi:hypothetical protein